MASSVSSLPTLWDDSEVPSYVGPTEFSSDGDSVFLVGAEPARFHVDSKVMCTASKFFAALFSKRWTRGSPPALQIQDPTEFVFTQDDPRAFGIMLDVIYHTNCARSLSAADLREVAILADKYLLQDALFHAATNWLLSRFDAPLSELGDLLQAAYLFNMAEAFSNITSRLVLEGVGPYTEIVVGSDTLDLHIPWYCIYFMETRRARIRERIYDLLLATSNPKCRCNCNWASAYVSKFLDLLRQNPPSALTLVSVRSTMNKIGDIRACVSQASRACRCAALPDTVEMRLEEAREMAPLCFDCVRDCKDHVGSCKHENHEDESESEGNDGDDDQQSTQQ